MNQVMTQNHETNPLQITLDGLHEKIAKLSRELSAAQVEILKLKSENLDFRRVIAVLQKDMRENRSDTISLKTNQAPLIAYLRNLDGNSPRPSFPDLID